MSGRPVVAFSFALNYAISALLPWSYHLGNLILHLSCATLVFLIGRKTILALPAFADSIRSATNLAGLIALIFAIHPLQTEAVTYVTQRTELFMGLFYLLTLYCAIHAWDGPRLRVWQFASVASCALGMASKEVMVSAPLIVVAYDHVFMRMSWREIIKRRRGLYLELAATWMLLAALAWHPHRSESVGFNLGVTALDYLRTQARVLAMYVKLVFWPHPLVLSYGWILSSGWRDCALQGAGILLCLAGTAWALMRRHWLGFLGAWFFLILAPTSSFVPIVTELAAERRMYLPMLAIVTAIVGSIGYWTTLDKFNQTSNRTRWRNRIGVAAAFCIAVTLCALTIRRNNDYRSAISIWSDTVQKRPENPGAHFSLAEAFFWADRLEEAIVEYKTSIAQRPANPLPRPRLAAAYLRLGRRAEAIQQYENQLRFTPDSCHIRQELAITLAELNRLPEAKSQFEAALRLCPNDAKVHSNYATLLSKIGRNDLAIENLREAIRLDPKNAEIHANLGFLMVDQGRVDEAASAFSRSIMLDPNETSVRLALANTLEKLGRSREAADQYRQVLAVEPQNRDAQGALQRIGPN